MSSLLYLTPLLSCQNGFVLPCWDVQIPVPAFCWCGWLTVWCGGLRLHNRGTPAAPVPLHSPSLFIYSLKQNGNWQDTIMIKMCQIDESIYTFQFLTESVIYSCYFSQRRSWTTLTLIGPALTLASCFLTPHSLATWGNQSVVLWTRAVPVLLLIGMYIYRFDQVMCLHLWSISPNYCIPPMSLTLLLFFLLSGSLVWAVLLWGLRTLWQTTLNIWSCWGGWESVSSTWKTAGCSWSSTLHR